MRKLLTGVLLAAGLALAAAVPAQAAPNAAAPAQTPAFTTSGTPQYICDGAGAGSCKSLLPGAAVYNFEPIYAIGRNSGAWRWVVTQVGTVTRSTFSYQPIDNQLLGQPILEIQLYASSSYCNGNSGGADVLKTCGTPLPASEQWVSDPSTLTLVNVGRSNDQDNWEVLCNPGGGGQLVIGTRDSCTTYHEQWSSVFS
jgi:hypothetical protein